MPSPREHAAGRARRAWLGLGAAAVFAAGLSGCGNSGPAALTVHCSGKDLAAPDSAEVDVNDPVLRPPLTAVPGVPRAAGTAANVTVPGALDPGDPRDGYSAQGWRVSRIDGSGGGPAAWSRVLARPRGVSGAEPDLHLMPHDGYVIAAGGNSGQYIAAVGANGRPGPVCALPPFTATDRHVELLPHAGVVILANPAAPSQASQSYALDGYSAATGQRVWSVATDTSVTENGVDFAVARDTVYVWEGRSGRIAAYDAATGQQLWNADSGTADPFGSPNGLLAAVDGVVYASTSTASFYSSRIVALRGTDGKVLWRRTVPTVPDTSDEITLSQVGHGEVLLGGGGKNEEYLLDARTGATRAAQRLTSPGLVYSGQPQLSDPGGQVAVAVAASGQIHVLSADPAVDRTIAIPSGTTTRVVVTGTIAYVRAAQPGAPVYGYDLATGRVAWTVRAPGSPADADVYAFDGGFEVGTFPAAGQFSGTVYR